MGTKIYLESSEIPEGFASVWNPSNVSVITSVSGFDDIGLIYKLVNDKATIVGYCGEDVDLEIPNRISHLNQEYDVYLIDTGAFFGCTSLTSVTFEDNCQIVLISDGAFVYCSSLTSITIPSSITSMGNDVFFGCTSLTIYCEASSQPSGWDSNWNPSNRQVIWDYNAE